MDYNTKQKYWHQIIKRTDYAITIVIATASSLHGRCLVDCEDTVTAIVLKR